MFRALKARAVKHGKSTEAEIRDILAEAVLPQSRKRAGDALCEIWKGSDADQLSFERDQTPHESMRIE